MVCFAYIFYYTTKPHLKTLTDWGIILFGYGLIFWLIPLSLGHKIIKEGFYKNETATNCRAAC